MRIKLYDCRYFEGKVEKCSWCVGGKCINPDAVKLQVECPVK